MLIFTLITGSEPKPNSPAKTIQEARSVFEEGNKLLAGKQAAVFSAACKELLGSCLQKDPAKRGPATTLLAKPWVKDLERARKEVLAAQLKVRRNFSEKL